MPASLAEPDALEVEPGDVPTPETFRAQLDWGEELFAERCAGCHGAGAGGADRGGAGPALFGAGALPRERELEAVEREADFVTAGDVLDWVGEEMPDSHPGSLAPAQYAAIVAFILHENRLAPELGSDGRPLTADRADDLRLRPE